MEAGKFLLAPRIAESKHWEQEGHRSPEELLATLEGGSASQAKRTLETGRQLHELPATEEAVRKGTLSGAKATEIAQAAALDPDAEGSLLEGAEDVLLAEVRERAQRVRATSSKRDPLAAFERIHAHRSFSSWTDSEGAFCFRAGTRPNGGPRLLAVLNPVVDRLRDDARAAAREAVAGSPPGTPAPKPEPEAALRADALFLLITGQRSALAGFPGLRGPTIRRGRPRHHHRVDYRAATGPTTGSTGTGRPPGRRTRRLRTTPLGPTISWTSSLRPHRPRSWSGWTSTPSVGERSSPVRPVQLDGQGPIPVPMARNLLDDAFLAYVFTEAGDIKAISHHGRTINQRLRTALVFRDRCCVVPRCGVAYGLEIDHVVPMEEGGPTELDNLALLCHHHHW